MQNIFFTVIMILTVLQPLKEDVYRPAVVLELFTSQGCSSCPPADALLDEVKNIYDPKDVIALSYHVDYWNYIGWNDPFSKKKFSDRQREYSRKFLAGSVYTPQVVVNGKEHFVGSNNDEMKSKLKKYLKQPSQNKIVLNNIKKGDKAIHFDYQISGLIAGKDVRFILVINERTTKINRGENKNRALKNVNIAVEEILVKASVNGQISMKIPEIVNENDELSLVALIQNQDLDIIGGSQVRL